jgi:hypothetical protein
MSISSFTLLHRVGPLFFCIPECSAGFYASPLAPPSALDASEAAARMGKSAINQGKNQKCRRADISSDT